MPEFKKKDKVKQATTEELAAVGGPVNVEEFQKTFDKAAEILGGKVVDDKKAEKPKVEPLSQNITEEDKKSYIRSLLAKERFTKTFSIFGGSLSLTFQSRTVREKQMLATDAVKLVMPDNEATQILKIILSLSKIVLSTGEKFQHTEEIGVTTIIDNSKYAAISKYLNDASDIQYAAIIDVFEEFESICDELYRRATDTDFWTKTVGSTSR